MTDKESDTAQADPELAELAASVVGEEVPDVTEGKDSVSPKDKPASEGKDFKPEDGETPASEGKTKTEGEGDDKPGEGGEGDDKEDPLKDLAADKDGALKVLLEHPDLGPLLNRWLDKASRAKVTAALAEAKPITEAETIKAETERAEDEHFAGMTKEQIAEEISGDEESATAYARYQQRQQARGTPNAEAVSKASEIYAYAAKVSMISGLVKESELSDEVKETLNPDHFTHLGAQGIVEWEKAVVKALVTHESSALTEKELEEKFEAYKEEHMAEVDGERPAIVSGRVEGVAPDFMKTDSGVLLESALSQKPKKGK